MGTIVTLAVIGIIWHGFAIMGMIMLAPYDKKWEGFYLGLLLGPIGLLVAVVMREKIQNQDSP